ncbi:hypothetical protein BX616_003120 [Lobosporangium transversale]|nr:hypothetical protein BX616_003120 [Lobosporangium transversale]
MPKASKAPAKGFYAVHVGKTKGIYFTWPECEKQVKGFIGAKYKKFETQKEAEEFVKNGPKAYTKPSYKAAVGSSSARPSPYNAAASSSKASGASSSSNTATTSTSTGTESSKDHRIVNGVRVISDAIVAYTDGSSLGNGKSNSRAGVGVFFGVNDPRNVSERLDGDLQTNQRAELTVR